MTQKDADSEPEIFVYPWSEDGKEQVAGAGIEPAKVIKTIKDVPRDDYMKLHRYNCLVGKYEDGEDIDPDVWDLEVYQLINEPAQGEKEEEKD